MMSEKLIGALIAGLCLAPGCGVEEEAVELGTEQQSHMHDGCEAAPVMISGDFDGDGTITPADLDMIEAYIDAGDYAAYFDMNTDGTLNGRDASVVARNLGDTAHARDAQMAALWAETEPYRNINNALAAGFVPFTPDLAGHGIHFANFTRVFGWGGFNPGAPEGLNYTAAGELIAAFYYGPAAIDLYDYGAAPVADTYFQTMMPPAAFVGGSHHDWHNHVGPCFGGATCPVAGFDQCVTESACLDEMGGSLWSPKFHMLHVWMFELNECGPFAGIDDDISQGAPHEPNHGACNIQDVVPVVVNEPGVEPLGFEPNACYGG